MAKASAAGALAAAALAGGAVGGGLLAAEAVLVFLAGEGQLWPGSYPWLAWAAGVFAGGAGGAALAAPGLRRASAPPSPQCIAGRVLPPLVATGTVVLALAHLNHWLLPALARTPSLAPSFAVVAVSAAFYRRRRRAWGDAAGRGLGSWGRLAAALALSALPAAGLAWLAPGPPEVSGIELWSPEAAPPPAWATERLAARRLVVLGIDGARWEVLEPLLRSGRLPHLASLVARGRRGVLRNPAVDRDLSPTAWTSLFTGLPPERHGIDRWARPASARRVKALWNILDDRGLRTWVVNVPGTFPAEALRHGAVIAGEPASEARPGTALGFRVAAGPSARLEVRLPDGPSRLFAHSTPGLVAWALGVRTRPWVRRLLESASPVGMTLLASRARTPEGPAVLALRWPGEGIEVALEPGRWGPWLQAIAGEERVRFRARAAAVGPDRLELYLSPLFRLPAAGLSRLPGLIPWLERRGEPYLASGDVACALGGDPGFGALCEQSLLAWEARRVDATRELMEVFPWDALVQVLTATDRAQHAFWPAVERAYEAADRLLGEILARAGPETLVLLASDHGAWRAGHHPDGIYVIAAPTVAPRGPGEPELGPTLEHVDLLPLVLAHLGLPPARDLPGRVPEELWPRSAAGSRLELPEPITSYGPIAAPPGRESLGPEALEKLRALGYSG